MTFGVIILCGSHPGGEADAPHMLIGWEADPKVLVWFCFSSFAFLSSGERRSLSIPPCPSIVAMVWDGSGMQHPRPLVVEDPRWIHWTRDGSAGRACPEHHGVWRENLNLNVKKLLFITGGISSPSPFVTWSGAVTLLISNK